MTAFLKKIRSLLRGVQGKRTTPFASVKSTRQWLDSLPRMSDYDLHHALVEGLERYNGDTRGDAINRLRVLRVMEETGLPLQAKIIDQFLQHHDAAQSARQALWRECHLFWDQLAVAYLPFLRLSVRGVDRQRLKPWSTEIAVKSLHYIALTMRWEYFRRQRPRESAWRRLHKTYRMIEIAGEAAAEFEIEGRKTSCNREYMTALLVDLANPHAFSVANIHPVMQMLDSLETIPMPELGLRRGRHTHMVDLSSSAGPQRIEDRWVPGKRLRYLDTSGVLRELEQHAGEAQGSPQAQLCKQMVRMIGRTGGYRDGPRKPRMGELQVVCGAEAVAKAYVPVHGVVPNTEIWTLRDESSEGLGFVLQEEPKLSSGCLLAVNRDGEQPAWQLLTVRWIVPEGERWLLGAESLSRRPKQVNIGWDAGGPEKETRAALFLPLTNTSQGVTSNLLLPESAYAPGRMVLLSDDGMRYRLQLGKIVETHESWVRVGFDVLSQEVTAE